MFIDQTPSNLIQIVSGLRSMMRERPDRGETAAAPVGVHRGFDPVGQRPGDLVHRAAALVGVRRGHDLCRFLVIHVILHAMGFAAGATYAQQPVEQTIAGFESGIVPSADGLEIAYEAGGEGDTTLLFVHCWTCNRTFWREQLTEFAEAGYRTVALDLGGHGASGSTRNIWTMEAFGTDVVAVARRLDLYNIILIGHSMGGTVALEAGGELGERLRGIVLVDAFRDPDDRMSDEEIDEFIAGLEEDYRGTTDRLVRQYMFAPGTDSTFVDRITDHLAGFDPAIGIGSIEQLFHSDYRPALRRLGVPMHAINAGYVPTNEESMRRYGIKLTILPNVGHFLTLERPGEFNRLLQDVISEM